MSKGQSQVAIADIVKQAEAMGKVATEKTEPSPPAEQAADVAKAPTLAVRTGRIFKPRRIVVYGDPGSGKTTAVSDIDNVVFFDLNNGSEMLDVRRYAFRPDDALRGHVPNTYDELMSGVRAVYKNPAGVGSVVFDLWLDVERLAVAHIIHRDTPSEGRVQKGDSLERYGYGAGKQALFDQCREFLGVLDKLPTRGIGVVVIAHSMVVKKSNPGAADFDRHVIQALDTKDVSMSRYLFGWADEVGYMHFDDRAAKLTKYGRDKGVTGTNRTIEFDHSATWDAKARLPMPKSVKVASAQPWQFMREALHRAYRMTPSELRQEILDELTRIGDPELAVKVDIEVKKVGDNIDKLTAYMQELRRRDPVEQDEQQAAAKDDEI
jgi:hypothetical protein